MKIIVNNQATNNTVYGFFPEIQGNSGRIDIHTEWVLENVTEYKRLGKSLEECDHDLTEVLTKAADADLFFWRTPEMEAVFHEDIAKLFAQ